MIKNSISIYQLARKQADISQKDASELLVVGERTLSDYENGRHKVPEDIVVKMTEIYKSSWLPYLHLKQTVVGTKFLPNITLMELTGSTLMFQKKTGDIQKIMEKLIDIACDGIIDLEEASDCEDVEKELVEHLGATLNLLISLKEKCPKRNSILKRA